MDGINEKELENVNGGVDIENRDLPTWLEKMTKKVKNKICTLGVKSSTLGDWDDSNIEAKYIPEPDSEWVSPYQK